MHPIIPTSNYPDAHSVCIKFRQPPAALPPDGRARQTAEKPELAAAVLARQLRWARAAAAGGAVDAAVLAGSILAALKVAAGLLFLSLLLLFWFFQCFSSSSSSISVLRLNLSPPPCSSPQAPPPPGAKAWAEGADVVDVFALALPGAQAAGGVFPDAASRAAVAAVDAALAALPASRRVEARGWGRGAGDMAGGR